MTSPELPPREAMLRDLRSGADRGENPLPAGGVELSDAHPDLAPQPVVDVERLESLNIHESDTDPAPDLQPEPEHWLAAVLRDKLQERKETGEGLAGLQTVAPESCFGLGYETAIYDLIAASSARTVDAGIITPDGERVGLGEERTDAYGRTAETVAFQQAMDSGDDDAS